MGGIGGVEKREKQGGCDIVDKPPSPGRGIADRPGSEGGGIADSPSGEEREKGMKK